MKESVITIALSILSGVLLIGAGAGIVLKDRTAPVISIEGKNNLSYTEGEDMEVLLQDVTAEDKEDGDVTESLRISKIYITEKDRAMVVYVAKDRSNNVAKLKREIFYVQEEAGAKTEIEQIDKEQSVEPTSTEQTSTSAVTVQEQPTGAKVIMLQNEATLKLGERFNIFRYIQAAVDAQGNDITRSMHVEGNYDTNVAGIYELQIYAVDAEQVKTNVEIFVLTVVP